MGAQALFLSARYGERHKKSSPKLLFLYFVVRMKGLEPSQVSPPEPKSGASTNFATSAVRAIVALNVGGVLFFLIARC